MGPVGNKLSPYDSNKHKPRLLKILSTETQIPKPNVKVRLPLWPLDLSPVSSAFSFLPTLVKRHFLFSVHIQVYFLFLIYYWLIWERETWIWCSIYLCNHWLLLICVLTWDRTQNFGVSRWVLPAELPCHDPSALSFAPKRWAGLA